MIWKVSVGRRINALIIFQAVAMVVVIAMAIYEMKVLIMDENRMYRFQLVPISDIASHLEKAAELQHLVHPDKSSPKLSEDDEIAKLHDDLLNFDNRYRVIWDAESADDEENRLFHEDLKEANQLELLDREKVAFDELQESLDELNHHFTKGKLKSKDHLESVVRVREALASLLELNADFAKVENSQIEQRAVSARMTEIAFGVFCIIVTVLLGLYIHKAIAPRITRLVSKVSRFKDFGVNEKIIEDGRDEITILANAIDAGFIAIADRERERDNFLAIAAHELKTPITSIQGFSSLLLTDSVTPETRVRAVEVINKQSWRLSRLIESLFLMMRARSGNLKFNPAPVDLAALTKKITTEIQPFIPTQKIDLNVPTSLSILGDESLLGHAIWSLFTCTSAYAVKDSAIEVTLKKQDFNVSLEVKIPGVSVETKELESLFTPFHTVQYESASAARGAVGLYLCREIVRTHHGHLYFNSNSNETVFSMELQA